MSEVETPAAPASSTDAPHAPVIGLADAHEMVNSMVAAFGRLRPYAGAKVDLVAMPIAGAAPKAYESRCTITWQGEGRTHERKIKVTSPYVFNKVVIAVGRQLVADIKEDFGAKDAPVLAPVLTTIQRHLRLVWPNAAAALEAKAKLGG